MFGCASINANAVDKDRKELGVFGHYKFKTNSWHSSNKTGRHLIITDPHFYSMFSCGGNYAFVAYMQHLENVRDSRMYAT